MNKIIVLLPMLCFAIASQASLSVGAPDDSIHQHEREVLLDEIEIIGIAGTQCLKTASSPFTVLNHSDLANASSINFMEIIQHQPGISQVTTGAGISKPIIRGLGYNRVVVVENGIRQEGQQWGDEHGLEVDGSQVWSVEVLKGPASLMYGSDAIAGVMVLHPAPLPSEGERIGSIEAEYNTNNAMQCYAASLAGRGPSHFVYDLHLSHKQAQAYSNRYDGRVPNSQFNQTAFGTTLGLAHDRGENLLRLSGVWFNPAIIDGEREAETGELKWPDGASRHAYRLYAPYQHVNHFKAVLDNRQELPAGTMKYVVGYQLNDRKEYEEQNVYGLRMQLHTINYDVSFSTRQILRGWQLSTGVGGMWQRSMNKGNEYLIPDHHLFDIGIYASALHDIGRLHLSGGVRADMRHLHSNYLADRGDVRFERFSRDFSALSASVGLVWNATNNLDIRANVARGFRAPNINELAANGVHEGSLRYEVGQQTLKPEYSMQADLGLNYTNRWLAIQVALFVNRISNYVFTQKIEGVQRDGFDAFRYTSGDACLVGGEAVVDMHLLPDLHFRNSFGWVDARLLHANRQERYMPLTPEPRWNSDIRYTLDAWRTTFNIGVEQHFRQSHYYAAYGTETPTPAYTLLNIGAEWHFELSAKKALYCNIAANNILDTAYQNHLSRLKYADINPISGRLGVYSMGRNIMFKTRLMF